MGDEELTGRLHPGQARRLLLYAGLFEVGLGVVALLLGALVGINPANSLTLSMEGALLGFFATFPLLPLFSLFLRSSRPAFARIRSLLWRLLRPVGRELHSPWAVALGLAAGVGEELLFRGLLLDGTAALIGPIGALVLSSVVFGLLHAVTPFYAVYATLMGLYLGGLYQLSGSLLPPILAHAAYDAVGLLLLTRRFQQSQ